MAVIFERFGFHFTTSVISTETGKLLFLVVKMKGRSSVEYPRLSVWEYSEEEYVSFIQERQIKAAMVLLDDFSFLSRCPSIEMLDLYPSYQAPNHISFDPVYEMPALRMLEPTTVYGYDDCHWSEFDCGKLKSAPTLEWFGASCKKGIRNIGALSGLKSLLLSSYNKSDDLRDAIGSAVLDTLSLLMCRVKNLEGLQNSKNLTVLKLDSCYKLENIDALYSARDSLQGLFIDGCKNIRDYSVLGELHNLTRLTLAGSGKIPTLSFLDRLPKLKTLTLSMDVEDGDLSWCDRLEHVSVYPNRRHFNRKDEDFPHLKRPEVVLGDEAIETWRRHVLR